MLHERESAVSLFFFVVVLHLPSKRGQARSVAWSWAMRGGWMGNYHAMLFYFYPPHTPYRMMTQPVAYGRVLRIMSKTSRARFVSGLVGSGGSGA